MAENNFHVRLISLSSEGQLNNDLNNGKDELGGKASGLVKIQKALADLKRIYSPNISVNIPDMTVLGTSVFDAFMVRNRLHDVALSDLSDTRIAHAFQNAMVPFEILRELRNLVEKWKVPLAIRSSGLMEDALEQPFAGVYLTKMIPNNARHPEDRLKKLIEAVKFVWASTYFSLAKDYCKAVNINIQDEKMALIIQKMVGKRHGPRYYPELSGVARSHNFYAVKPAKPVDGVVNLALGLGKTVVDGDKVWTYSPKYPQKPPLFNSLQDMIENTQNRFWVVNMGKVEEYDPIKETEYMQKEHLQTAEKDGVLDNLASTYDPDSESLSIGAGLKGPRVLTFAPLLSVQQVPLNRLITDMEEKFESELRSPVEIEFAMTFSPHQFNLLQVRPMKLQSGDQPVTLEELERKDTLIASKSVLGNGIVDNLEDIVYVPLHLFDIKVTRQIAAELQIHNQRLLDLQKPYLLIVIGRLGTFDPWLGIPVTWGQVCGAKVIVETVTKDFRVDLSQGSHYFHNIINLDIKYFSLPFDMSDGIRWNWLERQELVNQGKYTRHIRVPSGLMVKVDGRKGWGVVVKKS